MATQLPIGTIIKIGQISQGLAIITNEKNSIFKGSTLDKRWSRTISEVLRPLFIRYTANPVDPTLRQMAEWVLQLCGPLAFKAQSLLNSITAGLAVVTGPSNDSVNVGQSAIFTISVTSNTIYTIAWYRNGVLIPGQNGLSYTLMNAQLSDTGAQFSAIVTNAAGPVSSNVAVLTVTAVLQGQWYAGTTDYSALLEAGTDTVPYNGTFSITNGQPLVVPFPQGQVLFVVVKYPISQSMKTNYSNPTGGVDQGTVPGLAFNTNIFGGNNYIFSRSGNAFGINNITGQVTFS